VHELAAVEALVDALLAAKPVRDAAAVELVRVRRSSAFSEDALRQGFEALSRETPLAHAHLEIDVADLDVACRCGWAAAITADDLVGHMYVCPHCGAVQDVAGADGLELVEVRVTPRGDEFSA
jgi:Zn finger protein HypA/HybF involved in hydrogenase expression